MIIICSVNDTRTFTKLWNGFFFRGCTYLFPEPYGSDLNPQNFQPSQFLLPLKHKLNFLTAAVFTQLWIIGCLDIIERNSTSFIVAFRNELNINLSRSLTKNICYFLYKCILLKNIGHQLRKSFFKLCLLCFHVLIFKREIILRWHALPVVLMDNISDDFLRKMQKILVRPRYV